MKKYPYCRPSRRVSKETPRTVSEMSESERRHMCQRKRSSMTRSNPSYSKSSSSRKPRHLRQTRVYQTSSKTRSGASVTSSSTRGLPKGTKFVLGPGKYKYTAILPGGKRVNFGHRDYQHYRDSVRNFPF